MSMTARRLWPKATRGDSQIPSASGPRHSIVSVMACSASFSWVKSRRQSTHPVIPHMIKSHPLLNHRCLPREYFEWVNIWFVKNTVAELRWDGAGGGYDEYSEVAFLAK